MPGEEGYTVLGRSLALLLRGREEDREEEGEEEKGRSPLERRGRGEEGRGA